MKECKNCLLTDDIEGVKLDKDNLAIFVVNLINIENTLINRAYTHLLN